MTEQRSGRHSHARNVAQLVNGFGIGGTERQLVEQLRWLRARGWRVDVSCLEKEGEFLADLAELGLDPPEFSLRGTFVQPNTVTQAALLAERVRALDCGLLHCHDFYSNLVGSLAARLAGLPVIVSRRDLGAWIGPWRARALTLVTRRATRVLCNAGIIRDRLIKDEGVAPERIRVVYNGLDLARFDRAAARALAAPLPVEGDGPLVAVVGNMKHPVKGHADLVEAAARVVRAQPRCRFLLAGDGDLRPELERQVRALGLERHVLFLGRRTDVPALLARSTLLALPSHSEGLSNAVLEAMAARLPVVATHVGGNPELVRHGESGFLVGPRAPEEMARRILYLLQNQPLARRLGAAGRRRVERDFRAERMADAVCALYEELLEPARPAAHQAA